jgi:hypothetical protein
MGKPETLEDCSRLLEKLFISGKEKSAPLRMIYLCYTNKWEIPEWAAKAIGCAGFYAESGKLKSWDDFFGKPYPRGKQPRRLTTETYKVAVLARVIKRKALGENIDDDLFADIGKELGIGGKTTVKNLYKAARAEYPQEFIDELHQVLAIPNAKFDTE